MMFPSPQAPTGLGIVHVFDGVKCQLCHDTKICTCTCVTCDPTRERYEQTPQRLAERLADAERENVRLRDPQRPVYKAFNAAEVALFDACGPERSE